MRAYFIFILVGVLVIVSGCASKQSPITVLQQGLTKYQFTNDIRQSLQVDVNAPHDIRNIFAGSGNISIVFDGVSKNDNSYFSVVVSNLMNNLRSYYQNNNMVLGKVSTLYYIENEDGAWYRSENMTVQRPIFIYPTIWLRGPNTGATETSVKLKESRNENIVYLSGTDYKTLTLAGERFNLLIMGIDSVEDITKNGFQIAG